MNTLKLSDEQIDAICAALNETATARQATELEADVQMAAVFEKLRQDIRSQFPLSTAFKKLAAELEY